MGVAKRIHQGKANAVEALGDKRRNRPLRMALSTSSHTEDGLFNTSNKATRRDLGAGKRQIR